MATSFKTDHLSPRGEAIAVEPLLEALGKPAFVIDARGRVREANRLGRAMLDREGPALLDELVAATTLSYAHPRWVATELRSGAVVDFLLLEHAPAVGTRLEAQIARAASRWALTRRQTEILTLVAEGKSNRTIASIAGIAERTVEAHLTTLLEKAHAECRAELVAKVFNLE